MSRGPPRAVLRRFFATALNHPSAPPDQWVPLEGCAMLKRFILTFVAFIGLIVPGALLIVMLVAR
jgi:hypothetical protein